MKDEDDIDEILSGYYYKDVAASPSLKEIWISYVKEHIKPLAEFPESILTHNRLKRKQCLI